MLLFKALSSRRLRHSYRFVIVPETIGAITYLSRNEQRARAFAGGWILTSVAGPGKFGYKRSFQGGHIIDRVVRLTFRELQLEYIEYPFDINGSDERQYSATPFRIPIGTISKDKYYEYDYYHTSLDNLDFISADALLATLDLYLHCIDTLEKNKTYRACVACEPMLGKRGLYPSLGGGIMQRAAGTPEEDAPVHHRERGYNAADVLIYGDELDAIRWLLFYSDGQTSLLDIAEQTQRPMRQLHEVAEKLVLHKLLEVV